MEKHAKLSPKDGNDGIILQPKKLSALLTGITSKHHSDFVLPCILNCFHSCKLESHKKACKNIDICNVDMPSDDTKILEFKQYQKSDKAPFIIYADLESIIEKTDGCKNNLENLSTTKVSEPIHHVFQCLQYFNLETWKISMMYIEVKIA